MNRLLMVSCLLVSLSACGLLINKPDASEGPIVAASKSVTVVAPVERPVAGGSLLDAKKVDNPRGMHTSEVSTTSDHRNIFDAYLVEFEFVGPGCMGAQLWKDIDGEAPMDVTLPNQECRLMNLTTGERFRLVGPFQQK